MKETNKKINRILEIFFRGIKGEDISIKKLSEEYDISTKSISRDISQVKFFLSEHRDLVGNTEMKYSYKTKSYRLEFDDFLLSKELITIVKVLLGSRAFSKMELLTIISKIKKFTTYHDGQMLEKLIRKEMYNYQEVNHDCKSLINNIWQLTKVINNQKEITITYYKINREQVTRRLKPIAIIFSEFYFYLIAYNANDKEFKPIYYRADRIINIVEHRENFILEEKHRFDEGDLRKKIQFMFPGKCQKIRFEFTGPSVQAILDKLPTAKVIEVNGGEFLVEADIYGRGIIMYLLSQGSWVKVLSPPDLVDCMKKEIGKMQKLYGERILNKV